MLAAGTVGALLTLVLLISPSSKVNANKSTTVQLEISDVPSSSIAALHDEVKPPAEPTKPVENWHSFTVKEGDTLSKLFSQAGYNDTTMYAVLGAGNKNKELTRIYPGETIAFLSDESEKLIRIRLDRSPIESVYLNRQDDSSFSTEIATKEPEVELEYVEGVIDSSLFLAGQKAGMSQAQIMGLANIFGWDVDFALDIRKGDAFSLIYEKLYVDGKKYKNGKILAANFSNQGRNLEAVLFTDSSGVSNYYTPSGESMRKAFLRTPVDFARISSHFNLKRKHPVLHKIRAHKGTDYAASRGTPIKATGDGKVVFAGRKGGYGNAVILQHGQKITTLYAHMTKFARNVKTGKRVKQGQVIGYVGSTGLASGPHLHYEFRVNGVHKNPVRVKLPHAKPVPSEELTQFALQTKPLLAQLQTLREDYQLAFNAQ
ncbi:peptidase M23 [Oleiphilus sp. HI0071]|jgi:murein DD-endopeptidase MepM/ murein hydrolase activator NlpD|nr:peptidase M23 [Oleiphilus sp. HI0065]KZY79389.1 peptidase M23 [Oleiphilus sp. HI0071]KZY92410.1 peptidase M23 [Oleiphilus sp. HI0073]KZZ15115.1 peptidase M23 [Oleiphilus sp. HI0079]KZZ16922.1 peptidase M23 [Oleiphilus sp. HI0080]KZZ51448.1 peptidase M23 [Oleiphilus sp. HI0122]KZZ51479.1 peptidase M23 [Oleiphilus sp. HI0118]KZZ71140.1 peptidase M23 [Oleiphilus sp. HI0130]KZZ79686.1 peptidase M23 [Oleiphilus sp. HI0133]